MHPTGKIQEGLHGSGSRRPVIGSPGSYKNNSKIEAPLLLEKDGRARETIRAVVSALPDKEDAETQTSRHDAVHRNGAAVRADWDGCPGPIPGI